MEKMTQTKALAYVLKTYEETLPADVAEKLTAIKATIEKKLVSGKSEKDKMAGEAISEMAQKVFEELRRDRA